MQTLKKILFSKYFIAIYILAIFALLAASLLSYTPTDPSLNMATNAEPENFLGIVGAYSADICFKIFGYSSYMILALLAFWSLNIIRHSRINLAKIRLLFSVIFLVLFSASLELSMSNSNLEYFTSGGVVGWLAASFVFRNIPSFMSNFYVNLLVSLCAFSVFIIASSFSLKDWYNAFVMIYNLTLTLGYNALKYTYKTLSYTGRVLIYLFVKLIGKKDSYKEVVATPTESEDFPIKKPKPAAAKNKDNKADKQSRDGLMLPDLSVFNSHKSDSSQKETKAAIEEKGKDLEKVLKDFGIRGEILGAQQGPVVTLYEFEPSPGTKSSRVIGLSDDIARSLSALSTRISVIPGRNVMGIELPRKQREMFYLKELIASNTYQYNKHSLPIVLGKDIGGNTIIVDLAKMPHLLVAGTTGSGKSVAINTMIVSLLFKYKPEECKFIMIDPKMLELSIYDGIPHLLTPVVTEPGKAVTALKWAVKEMESRYKMMSNLGVRNIESFNKRIEEAIKNEETLERTVQTGFDPDTGQPKLETIPIPKEKLPYIVIIVDEMADLMLVSGKEIEASIQRLAQMARAAGIHLIMATQRPSVDVITGVIKANFPSRVSFKVTSKIDSRTILGEQGAEQLLGMGDMLYTGGSDKTTRVHGPFVDDNEVERIVSFLKSQQSPIYINSVTDSEELEDDESSSGDKLSSDSEDKEASLYKQAVQIVKRDKKVSTSYIQRCLRIGYNRAANIVEQMQKEGLISEPNHAGKRRVLMEDE